MNRQNWTFKLFFAAVLVLFGSTVAPPVAHADLTCSGLLGGKYSYLEMHGGSYGLEITVTKDPLAYVTYSVGRLRIDGPYLYGPANLEFSDRFTGIQNFDINAVEATQIWLGKTGRLWIYNNDYSYDILSDEDMPCVGGLVSKYVSGLGVVTVAIRDWIPPIR